MNKQKSPVQHFSDSAGFAHLVLIIIIAAAAIGGYYLWKNYGVDILRPKAAGPTITADPIRKLPF